jgi:hypothetical protein
MPVQLVARAIAANLKQIHWRLSKSLSLVEGNGWANHNRNITRLAATTRPSVYSAPVILIQTFRFFLLQQIIKRRSQHLHNEFCWFKETPQFCR